ncbi:hypothetical protein, partial [Salmonella sp. s60732]|uniref:hypothetical protein n=1 Tax=Salmonella sp. s60732 TaxID=3160132 RepID=UPI003753F891
MSVHASKTNIRHAAGAKVAMIEVRTSRAKVSVEAADTTRDQVTMIVSATRAEVAADAANATRAEFTITVSDTRANIAVEAFHATNDKVVA